MIFKLLDHDKFKLREEWVKHFPIWTLTEHNFICLYMRLPISVKNDMGITATTTGISAAWGII
jgi:hypothetical protein